MSHYLESRKSPLAFIATEYPHHCAVTSHAIHTCSE